MQTSNPQNDIITVIRAVFAVGTRYMSWSVNEFQGMALNGLFCADVLRPLDLVPLTDFTCKYHSDCNSERERERERERVLSITND